MWLLPAWNFRWSHHSLGGEDGHDARLFYHWQLPFIFQGRRATGRRQSVVLAYPLCTCLHGPTWLFISRWQFTPKHSAQESNMSQNWRGLHQRVLAQSLWSDGSHTWYSWDWRNRGLAGYPSLFLSSICAQVLSWHGPQGSLMAYMGLTASRVGI